MLIEEWIIDKFSSSPILIRAAGEDQENEEFTQTLNPPKVKKPRKYKVLLHNDDYTTMEFVIHVLQKHFGKTLEEAQKIMLTVHHDGVGVCGIYSYEVAETKVAKVMREAKSNGHPLLCTCEPE